MQVQLVDAVRAAMGRGCNAADLYAGAGVFASVLAHSFEQVTVVEENPLAVALARENLKNAGAKIDYYAFSAQQFSTYLLNGRSDAIPYYGTIIADPPRPGLCNACISLLTRIKPETFIYVSCNPPTLARDAKLLCENGFRLESVRVFDFYPQTAHIECMAVFKHPPST
jgi:23S rRNA (uracil1939-C5)-methyltransferase